MPSSVTTSINQEYNRAAFDLTITTATCYSQFKLFQIVLYQAVLIFVADIIMLLAPMLILCGLQMPARKIAALMAIFGTGLYNYATCFNTNVQFRHNRLYRPRRPVQHARLSA